MELSNRKRNRLECYDYGQNGAYFVTICVQDRFPLLSEVLVHDSQITMHLLPMGHIAAEYMNRIPEKYPNVCVDRFVIMPDHIHMILRLDSAGNDKDSMEFNLGKILGWYKYHTTKQCNILRNMAGEKFWQRSYYDHVIRNFIDYQEIWQYIDNNPRKWVLERNLI